VDEALPSLSYYLGRIRRQPLEETLQQARMLVAEKAHRTISPWTDSIFRPAATEADVLKRCGVLRLKQRADSLFPSALLDVLEPYSGKDFGVDLPWHTDTKSGYMWDVRTYYRQVPLSPRAGVDVKVPWDFSRGHHIAALGASYRATKDEQYARECVRRIDDWIERNPYRQGVNWMNAMEAGIRAINWIAALECVRSSSAFDDKFAVRVVTSLYNHATFIHSNLEYRRGFNSNHYLCDLAGLLYIASSLPELRLESERQFAIAELERELQEQVTDSGVDYEHSTFYHRFVLEIFEASFLVTGKTPDRLARMRKFLAACLHPDGTLPQIGDNDGGRLLPTRLAEIVPSTVSEAFPDPGFYSMRGKDSHVVVSAAPVGMRGRGSHSHNDVLSFEYWFGGHAWIVDPGTHVYLRDTKSRNWFRSTEAHSTVRVDGMEINRFEDQAIFQMDPDAHTRLVSWEDDARVSALVVQHDAYARLKSGSIVHQRRFDFTKSTGALQISDTLSGSGQHRFEWFFQLHPDTSITAAGPSEFRLQLNGKALRLYCQIPLVVEDSWYSPGYGEIRQARRLRGTINGSVPVMAETRIEPC
jgi:uncharacterized heparinase superfamily protein